MVVDEYKRVAQVIPLGQLVDDYIKELRGHLTDAVTQGENDSDLGMAISVGKAMTVLEELQSVWNAVKE